MSQAQKLVVQLLVLVAIAGGLGGYAYFGIFKPEKAQGRKQDHDLRLFAPEKLDEKAADGKAAAEAKFNRLIVTWEGETTELEREDGAPWKLVKPVRAKADALTLDGITSQLQNTRFKATVVDSASAADFAKYGLDQPRFVAEAWALVNGETRHVKLAGGAENTFDGSVFIRRNDEPAVYAAPGGVRYALGKTTYDLRDKLPFSLDDKQLEKVALKSLRNAWELKREGNRWKLGEEFADATTVAGLFGTGSGARAAKFFDDTPANRASHRLDQPDMSLLATFKDGRTVKLSATRVENGDQVTVYGLREDDDGNVLAELPIDALGFDRHIDDLRDQSVLQFTREAVVKAVFHKEDGSEVVLEKDSADASVESWRITAPRPAKAKIFKVTGALWTLGAFKALRVVEKQPKDWKKYGFDDKARYVALYGEGGVELARLTIGAAVPDAPSAFYVRGSRDAVLESEGSRFTELPFELSVVIDEPEDAGY